MRDLNPQLSQSGEKSLVARIGRELGVVITRRDWEDFRKLEAGFTATVTGGRPAGRARLAQKVRRALGRYLGA
jgi:hypothetical protein